MTQHTAISLDLSRDGVPVGQHTLNAQSITLGSGPAAMIRLGGAETAALHAVINRDESGQLWLLDLGAGTTRLDGQPVHNAPLRDGATIQIGETTIAVSTEPATETVAVSPSDDTLTEDPLQFLMRASPHSPLGDDPTAPPVFEVAAVWGDVVMDIKHIHLDHGDVTIGAAVGHRWRLLGAPIAWVPPTFSKIAWMAAPALSEVRREWRDDFYAPDLDRHALLSMDGDRVRLRFRPGWEGFVDQGETRTTLSELLHSDRLEHDGEDRVISLPLDSRIVVDVDGVIFVGRRVQAGRRVIAPLAENIDYPFAAIMATMSFAFLMLSTVMLSAGPPVQAEVVEIPDRFAEVIVNKLTEEPPTPLANQEPRGSNEDSGEKAKGDEGKAGRHDAKMDRAKGERAELDQKKVDRDVAMGAGVLGAMSDSGLDSVFGSSALAGSVTDSIGGLYGAAGVQLGAGGLGGARDGLGGGGRVEGIGGLGTSGRGRGDGLYGSPQGGDKREGSISSPHPPIILGTLDKHLIDQVVKRHMSQIRYCYQRELNKSPSLAGKVVVKFVIAGDGMVSRSSIKSSSLGSAAVEQCITSRFMRFKFPEPKGNGIVIVSYPFIFSPG